MLEKKISDKIQQTRKNKGLTLAQLSEEVGLSKELLSRIENNQVSSPIATLSKVARGLEVPISIFFEEDDSDQERYAVTYSNDRKQVVRRGTKIGFTYFSLTGLKSQHLIEPFNVKYPVIAKEPKVLFAIPGGANEE
jgi:transcriptional regulator with XRE-family HTH domain